MSAEASSVVWDTLGPVDSRKNRQFVPKLHACEECKTQHHITQPVFPPIFSSIRPAQQGADFFEATDATPGLPVPAHMLSTLFV